MAIFSVRSDFVGAQSLSRRETTWQLSAALLSPSSSAVAAASRAPVTIEHSTILSI